MRTSLMVLLLVAQTAAAQTLTPDRGRVVRDSRGGGGRAFSIQSAILGERRRINVALPASFEMSAADRRYPVTVVLDGEASLPAAASVADELTRNGQVPEAIIVAIENTNRLRDLTPPGISVSGSGLNEGGDRFLDFIERELLPEVDRQFRGGAPRLLIGHSSGGVLATYAAATRDTYRSVIAIDTPVHLQQGWLASKLVARAREAKMPLRYASYEARFGWTDRTWNSLTAAAPPAWKLHRERLAMENHESIPLLGMYLGMRQVYADYSMLSAPQAPTTQILPYYAKVGEALGAPVLPPRKLLTNVVEDLLMEGRGSAAREAYVMQVRGYGEPAGAAALAARIADVARRPAPIETVEGLLATPFPSPAEAAAFIGEWTGNHYINEAELGSKPVDTLRIRIVDGRVEGETIMVPDAETRLVQKWSHMRVTPTGLAFGYMNGMRPRGMLIHDAVLKDGVMTGRMRFGGVDFQYPEGMTPPEIKFVFRKVK